MNKLQQVSDAIKAKLETMVGAGKPFKAVYDYHTMENSGYPFVTFECIGWDASILDNCYNNRDYMFQVLVHQEIVENDRKDAKQIIYKSMSDVFDELDQEYTLGGVVEKGIIPVKGSIAGFETKAGKTLVGEIMLNCQTITSII